jgi:acyl-CoA synthetase (AMP-forming)/AMP-acid ligase II
VQIGDPAGRPLPAQHVGHVLIRGSSVTQGYYRDAEATAAASRPADWLDTGDLGFLTKTGRLVITGRTKDVIILNGANLYPHDIERLIEGVAGVTTGQVAVCGVKFRHASLVRTALAAFVVFRQGAEPFVPIASAIRTQVMTAAGIQVDYVVPVMRLPRTTSGKIQRFELAAAFEDNLFDAPSKTAGIRRRLTIPQAVPTAGIAP